MNTTPHKVHFNGENLLCLIGKYQDDDTPVIRLVTEDGEPYVAATVSIPDCELERGHVLIKNWSENQGILEALVAENIIEDTGKTVQAGMAKVNVVRILIQSSS